MNRKRKRVEHQREGKQDREMIKREEKVIERK